MLLDWVERGAAPPKSATVTGNAGSLPLCSYPTYPRYNTRFTGGGELLYVRGAVELSLFFSLRGRHRAAEQAFVRL